LFEEFMQKFKGIKKSGKGKPKGNSKKGKWTWGNLSAQTGNRPVAQEASPRTGTLSPFSLSLTVGPTHQSSSSLAGDHAGVTPVQ
jgi:hypothetical protein